MKKPLTLLTMFLLATSAAAQIQVTDGYVRALPPGVVNSSAYMTLSNPGDTDLELTGASSSVAEKVSMHSTMNHNGMMHMMLASGLTVPAHGELRLESGGNHLMLEALKETLVPGAEVELVLDFSDGMQMQVLLPVRSVLDE